LPTYWLDADVYIQAKNGPYRFEFAPGFWEFLARQFDEGNIKSPKKVYDELTEGSDLLASWCRRMKNRGICSSSGGKEVQECYGRIANYVYTEYKPHQADEFLKGGDGWVIAHAMATGGIVVAQESPRSKKGRIKVPTISRVFGVKCIGTYDMLGHLGFSL
jgi:hypothetical protein